MNQPDATLSIATFPDQIELHDSIGDMPLSLGEIRPCLELGSENDGMFVEAIDMVGVVAEAITRVACVDPESAS